MAFITIGTKFNANEYPKGKGMNMPYEVADIHKTYNYKNELIKIVYVGKIYLGKTDEGKDWYGKTEFTGEQIRKFLKRGFDE